MDRIKELSKSFLYFYQRTFWYVAQAKNEALKPLGFWNETLLILTFFAVSGYKPTVKEILVAYLVVIIVAAIIGKIIVATGIVSYNTKIGNQQNPELMEIHKEVAAIKKLITEKLK